MGLPILILTSNPCNVYDQETFHHNEDGQMSSSRSPKMSLSWDLTQNGGQGTGGGRKLGFIDPLFHIVNCSGIWNPPPRDLLHKQKILGKSPRPARDAFMSSELFFMELNYFWALRPRHLKDLAFFWPELLALLSPFFYFTDPLKWRLNIFQQEFIE